MRRFVTTYQGKDQDAAQHFRRLQEILLDELEIPEHHTAPPKPRIGRLVVADGTDWDPLSVGVPRLVWFNGTAWVALDA